MLPKSAGFYLTDTGFQIRLENGYTLSVQWGPSHYTSRRSLAFFVDMDKHREWAEEGSPNAEIAIISPDGDLIKLEGENDTVKGWVLPDEILGLLELAKQLGEVPRIQTDAKLLRRKILKLLRLHPGFTIGWLSYRPRTEVTPWMFRIGAALWTAGKFYWVPKTEEESNNND